MPDVWKACGDWARPVEFAADVLRLVESQEQVATQRLVGNLAEQALLEALLERSKPPLPAAARGLHYLLATPFRYPPLRYGSRFGRRHEPALFYASCTEAALLAESAYYRCVFWHGMTTPPADPLRTQHTVFGARIEARCAYRLDAPPFDEHAPILASPNDYAATQALGSALREVAADAVVYPSARDPGRGLNVGLYAPSALALPQPTFQQEWLCETAADHVSFRSRSELRVHTLPLSQFLVDGVLPTPAA
jgi:hypothetical protein